MPPAQVVMLDALVRFRNLRDEHFVWFNAPYSEAIDAMHKSQAKIKALQKEPFDYLQSMLLLLLPAVDKVYGTQVRTERRLASLARMYSNGGQGAVTVPLTQDVIASMAGTSRPTTNQALRAIEEAGIIAIGRSKIQIMDLPALLRRAH